MVLNTIHRLDRPIAPCLIKVLYWIAIVVIGIGTLLGIAGEARTLTAPVPSMAALEDPSRSANTNGSNTPSQDSAKGGLPADNGRGLEYRRYDGYRFHHHGQLGWLRNLPPSARAGVSILFSLLRGVIALLIVRILAEIGLAILAMGTKAKEKPQ